MIKNQRKFGILISYVGQMVHILSGLLYTPIMLRLLGQSEYGLYQLVYSVVAYLGLLSMGFDASYMRFYAREKAKSDQEGVSRLNGMFLLIFLCISCICVICGIFMLVNIQSIFGSGLTSGEYTKARILMILMIINLSIGFPNSVFNCIVTSQERFVFQKTLILLQNLCNPLLSLPLLLLGFGSIGMVSVTTFLTFIVFFSNLYYCLKKLKVRFSFQNLQFSLLKEMWVFTIFIFLNQIVDQINWSVDKFLLGRIIGTSAVAIYGVGATINTLYLQFSTTVSNVFVPKVNQIVFETGDDHALTKLFTKVGRIQFIILFLILSGFFFFGKPFIAFWAGEGYQASYYITLFLIVPVTVPLIQNLGIEIQRAKNKHKARSIVYFFIAIANVLLSIPLIYWFGPMGAAFGTTISLTCGNILFMNWYYHNHLHIDILYYWKHIFAFVPALILPLTLGILINVFVSIHSVFVLALCILVYTMVYVFSIFLWGLNEEERANFQIRKSK
ncbi:MAG: oligosaccharide flippase family protein [Bacillota bacterium]|nr:oligosaccharide flippase family protein [Bacillota bacterium]